MEEIKLILETMQVVSEHQRKISDNNLRQSKIIRNMFTLLLLAFLGTFFLMLHILK